MTLLIYSNRYIFTNLPTTVTRDVFTLIIKSTTTPIIIIKSLFTIWRSNFEEVVGLWLEGVHMREGKRKSLFTWVSTRKEESRPGVVEYREDPQ